MNATYIISVARKLGCSIFLLPEDILEVYIFSYCTGFIFPNFFELICLYVNQVNQRMMLILAASIMNWSLQQQSDTESTVSDDTDVSSVTEEISNLSTDDGSSDV